MTDVLIISRPYSIESLSLNLPSGLLTHIPVTSTRHQTDITKSMASSTTPQLIFGCGGLGNEFIGQDSVAELLRILMQAGVGRLDTSALYPPTDVGASQRLLGQTAASQLGFVIDTKVLINIGEIKGSLKPEKIEKSINESYDALKFAEGQRIHVFYARRCFSDLLWLTGLVLYSRQLLNPKIIDAPDIVTPLRDQAAGFDAQYKKGLFDKAGCLLLIEVKR